MKIIHLSDTHIIEKSKKNLYGINPSLRLEKALQSIRANHSNASMIIISGDLVNTPSSKAYNTFCKIIKRYDFPVYPIIGNHDDRDIFFDFFPQFKNDGFAQYIVDIEEFAFVFLDTNVKNKPYGRLCSKRLKWIEETLKNKQDKEIYIFMHHHPLASGMYEMDNTANLKESDKFWNIIEKYKNIKHITFGHLHRITQMNKGNISLHSTKSTVFEVAYRPNEEREYLTNEEKPTYAIMNINRNFLLIHHHEFLNEDDIYEGNC